jgi:glutathione S-transferase
MLELYFRPFACSLAARIALLEGGIGARYHQVDLATKRVVGDGADFLAVAPKGKVPALRLADGSLLTEAAAVLQYLADLRPDAELAPRPGDPLRYRLQEWLSFGSTEIHKGWSWPTFMPDTPEPVRAFAREHLPRTLAIVAAHLETRPHLLGERFSVADAHLVWTLALMRFAGIDLARWPSIARYQERIEQRPSVAKAFAIERALL